MSSGEETFSLHCRALLAPQLQPVRQHQPALALGRSWALDFSWPERSLAVEVDGSVHRIKARFRADLERSTVLTLLGWRVLRFSPAQVESGKAIDVVIAVLNGDLHAALDAAQRKEPSVQASPRRSRRPRPR